MNIEPGRMVRMIRGYSARAFGLSDEEVVRCRYDEFSRDGRAVGLVALMPGQEVETLTDGRDGMAYARAVVDGRPWAVLLLPGAYQP